MRTEYIIWWPILIAQGESLGIVANASAGQDLQREHIVGIELLCRDPIHRRQRRNAIIFGQAQNHIQQNVNPPRP